VDELLENIREVIALCLEENPDQEQPHSRSCDITPQEATPKLLGNKNRRAASFQELQYHTHASNSP
jgi:hypothetical protein